MLLVFAHYLLTVSDEITQKGFFKTVVEPFIEEMAYGFNGTILIIEERFAGDDYSFNIYSVWCSA